MTQRGGVGQVVEHFRQRGLLTGGDEASGAYRNVVAVFACVRKKAEAMAKMLLMTSSIDGQVIESGPLVQLAERPAPGLTGRKFWRLTSSYLDLFGRFHWRLVKDAVGRVLEVWPINPLLMKPVIDRATGELRAWRYRATGKQAGQDETIPADEVHTVIDSDLEDPQHPFEGLSANRAAQRAIAQVYKADLTNLASLDNGVEPGGAFVMSGTASEGQADRLGGAGDPPGDPPGRRAVDAGSGGGEGQAGGRGITLQHQ